VLIFHHFLSCVLLTGTVADNVRYGPQLRGKKLTEAEVKSLLHLADLDPALCSKPASELSVGQAQRVALARTLANDPEATPLSLRLPCHALSSMASSLRWMESRCICMQVLLLDEPTSALDPISTQNIEEAIVRLKKTRGLTTVIVSHSVKQIQRIADLVCLVVAGEVVEVLAPSDLSDAKHPMARRFLELSG
jgi:ABC-type methionine transport system ATPase subunit